MKCPECGVQEDADGARWHATHCPFAVAPDAPIVDVPALEPVTRTGTGEPINTLTHPARVLQFVGHLTLNSTGMPLQLSVLVNGRLAEVFDVSDGNADELTIGDAVDVALANEGRRCMSSAFEVG